MTRFLFLLILLVPFFSRSQSVLPFRADTVRIEKIGGSAELHLRNATRDSLGVLTNIGNGRTRFLKSRQSGDTVFVGKDTLIIPRLTNATATGDTLLINNTVKRLAVGYGISRTVTSTSITDKIDTSQIATLYDLTQIPSGGSTGQGVVKGTGDSLHIGNTDSSTTSRLTQHRYVPLSVGKKLQVFGGWFESDTTRRNINGKYYKDTLYFFGDSHTVGDAATYATRRFSSLSSVFLGYAERNFGVGGTLMQGNTTIIPAIPQYAASTPGSRLIINFGTNDGIFRVGTPGTYDTATFKTAYIKWVDSAVARGWPLDHIVIMQLEYSNLGGGYMAEWRNYKTATRTVAYTKGTLFLPTWDMMEADAAEGFVASDGFHPNDDGHAFSARALATLLKGSVKNSNQAFAINGIAEFQTIFYKNPDSANATAVPAGLDSSGKLVAFKPNAFIRNNKSLSILDAANFGISGMGFAKTALRSQRLEITGTSSARDVGAPALQAWVDGTGAHIWGVRWNDFAAMNLYIHEFSGNVQVGPGTLNTNARLSVGGGIIASGTVQAMAALTANSGPATQIYYAAAGYGGIQSYDWTGPAATNLSMQEFGGDVLINTGTDAGAYKLQVEGESFLKDRITTGQSRTFNNQGLTGTALSVLAATYTDANTSNGGTVAHVAVSAFARPTLSSMGTSVTYTNSSTVYIDNAPADGTNVTTINPYALYIKSGKSRIGDSASIGGLTFGSRGFSSSPSLSTSNFLTVVPDGGFFIVETKNTATPFFQIGGNSSNAMTYAGIIGSINQRAPNTERQHFLITSMGNSSSTNHLAGNIILRTGSRASIGSPELQDTDDSVIVDLNGAGRVIIKDNDAKYAANYGSIFTSRSLVDKGYVDSISSQGGTYTPTLFNTTNVTSTTAQNAIWTRNGNQIHVAGSFDVTTTLAAATEVGISLPLGTSAFAAATDLNGVANAETAIATNGICKANVANGRAQVNMIALSVGGSGRIYYSFDLTFSAP